MKTTSGFRIEHNPKWIRGIFKGETIIDSRDARLVWEIPYYPVWYFPVSDLKAKLLENGKTHQSPSLGTATRYDLVLDDQTILDAAWCHLDAPVNELRRLVRMDWGSVDTWLEEDVEVFVHPRSPEARVDILGSSRHIRVLIKGAVVADSTQPRLLFETGLTTRFYLPKAHVRMDLLSPTETSTACPYKGWANYWSATIGGVLFEDIAWSYPTPLPESTGIAGLICFYNERVAIEIDGREADKPDIP